MVKGLVLAAALVMAGNVAAMASPLGALPNGRPDSQPGIVLVSGGCGFDFHRDPFGICVPNRRVVFGGPAYVRLPPPCPRGYHRDRDPARPICYPNF